MTPATPMELPIEVEIEVSPAGSLKQAPLWKEMYQLLTNPYAYTCSDPGNPATCVSTLPRRPGFGVAMPPLNIWPLGYNFLTAQPLRLRTDNGEVSWDQPGPLFDPDLAEVPLDEFNTPLQTRTIIGHVVACPDNGAYHTTSIPGDFCTGKPTGSLVVYNPDAHPEIPEHGVVIAVPALLGGDLQELSGESTTATGEVEDLEIPINEEDFFGVGTRGVPSPLRPYAGRRGAEILGKALFWDQQVGSDGVQACGSCHFHAGVDNRTKNQLNPGSLFNDPDLEVTSVAGSLTSNVGVEIGDFPFHKRINSDVVGDGTDPAVVTADANDVMSSMGVTFKKFVDIPTPGAGAFGAADGFGVKALLPDVASAIEADNADPIPLMQGVRRIEPRNTPTFHGAAFNHNNFWDARAKAQFNGGSVFGFSDPQHHILINTGGNTLVGATNGHIRPELIEEGEEIAEEPVRILFSSLASQAAGPPLSNFEMSFDGRNWPKLGKKLLQGRTNALDDGIQPVEVTPLANQLVATDDSRLGPFSNQGGSVCQTLGFATAVGKPGLCISYGDLIQLAFRNDLHRVTARHVTGTNCGFDPATGDPFDGYCLSGSQSGPPTATDTNEFSQMEANFALFFGLAVQAYEVLTIPDHTPLDQFMDLNPLAGNGVGEPGDQAVLFPTLIPHLVDSGQAATCAPPNVANGRLCLPPGFGPDEVAGFDIFAGANLTAALAVGSARNPEGFGSNPFTRNARCMLCHLGPEQTDHSINIVHGLLKMDAEFEYPTPPIASDPGYPPLNPVGCAFDDCLLPASEPSGVLRAVTGLILAEEVTEGAQDQIEVEPRNFAAFDDPDTPWDDRVVGQQAFFAFGDQGVYNVGVRPTEEDLGLGGVDPWGWPLSTASLNLMNITSDTLSGWQPCDGPFDSCVMSDFDPENLESVFEESGDGATYAGSAHTADSINPGFERSPINPQLPSYMHLWLSGMPAGELHPQIDELAGMVPNTLTPPNGGPGIEFPEVMFGADTHCALYDPAQFAMGPPNFGWGAPTGEDVCPNNNSGVSGNVAFPGQGTWPVPNRVLRHGAFKAPSLRNSELTAPYFHAGNYATLGQVVQFYLRGGDFPLTNQDSRDPHLVNVRLQAFGFGHTGRIDVGDGLLDPINFDYLQGTFVDGLPDTAFQYTAMPDTTHPITPEPSYMTPEFAEVLLVKFLLALTDPRVKFERAPFDRPEMFVPIDGVAPENTGGRTQLAGQSGVPCDDQTGPGAGGICFLQLEPVGAGGRPDALPAFLGVTNNPNADCSIEISHFCR